MYELAIRNGVIKGYIDSKYPDIASDTKGYPHNISLIFPRNMCSHQNSPCEMLLRSIHNMFFRRNKKIIIKALLMNIHNKCYQGEIRNISVLF